MAEQVLALDIGSSSVRATVYTWQASTLQQMAQAQIEYALHSTPDGHAELALEPLEEHIAACIDAALKDCAPDSIAAVGCDTLVGNLVALDGAGAPLTPAWSWADTRAASAASTLRAEWDTAALWQRTGTPIHSAYWPARLRWLATSEPDLWHSTAAWATLGEFFTRRWTGTALLSRSVVAWNGMLDRTAGTWDRWLLDALALRPQLLGPIASADQTATLLPAMARRWPALRRARWVAPFADGLASNVGCGGIDASRVIINLGTSGALRVLVPAGGPVPAGLWRYQVSPERELLGGALSNGGNVLQWAEAVLRLPDLAALEAALADRPFGSHGLTVRPALAGERSPSYDDTARASLAGLGLHTSAIDIAQALMEAVATSLGAVYALVQPLLPANHSLIASGGALASSPVWRTMVATALKHPIAQVDVAEATSRGAALIALEALGYLDDLQTTAPPLVAPDS